MATLIYSTLTTPDGYMEDEHGKIGIAHDRLRERYIALGERLGLHRDRAVSKAGASPSLPMSIGSVVAKNAGGHE
jgi:hypothetical protein